MSHPSSRPVVLAGLLIVLAGAAGCAINPVSGDLELSTMSPAREAAVGRQMAVQVEREIGLVRDPELVGYVGRLGARLAAHSPRRDVNYRFEVADMPEPNAFALPGGYIYVSRGLLALTNSEAELAGVIGHEIGHVAARHAAQRETRAAGVGILTTLGTAAGAMIGAGQAVGSLAHAAGAGMIASYSRDQEREADEIGQQLAAKSGYDPQVLADFLRTLGRYTDLVRGEPHAPSFFDSHPPTAERVQTSSLRASTLPVAEEPALSPTRASYLSNLVGLVVGPSRGRGVLVGRRWLHLDWGIALELPPGWRSETRPDLLVAIAPARDAMIRVDLDEQARDAQSAARSFARETGLSLLAGRSLTLAGLPAYHAKARAPDANVPTRLDLTWIAHPRGVVQIGGAATSEGFTDFQPEFASVAASFRVPDRNEFPVLRERRIQVVRARGREGLAGLGRRTGSAWGIEQTASANGLDVDATLREGQLVKIAIDLPYRR